MSRIVVGRVVEMAGEAVSGWDDDRQVNDEINLLDGFMGKIDGFIRVRWRLKCLNIGYEELYETDKICVVVLRACMKANDLRYYVPNPDQAHT